MEIIGNYIEMAFSTLPKTPELYRLKEEMTANLEDKYLELKAQGKTENEAVGMVIAEFGNIEEIAKEMGISVAEVGDVEELAPTVTLPMAEEYVEVRRKASIINGFACMLCILGASVVVGASLFVNQITFIPIIGVLILLVLVAIAIGLFVFAGSKTKKWDYIEKGSFRLEGNLTKMTLETQQDAYRPTYTLFTIIGIVMYILGVGILLLGNAFAAYGNVPEIYAVGGVLPLLWLAAVATLILIVSHSKNTAYNALLKKEEFDPKTKKSGHVIGAIAAIWWPLSVALFLALGFLGKGGFKTAWIVWPISGVLFGGIAALINALATNKNN